MKPSEKRNNCMSLARYQVQLRHCQHTSTNHCLRNQNTVISSPMYHLYTHHHIRFRYLWCCGCPGLRGRQRLTLVLHEFLSNGLTPSRLHIVISFLTHADHVFLSLPRSLVPGSPNRVMELMHEVARCMCPYHLRRHVYTVSQKNRTATNNMT